MAITRREMRPYLKDVADYIEWYLSDWMDEKSLTEVISKLQHPDLLDIWIKLGEAADDHDDFQDFFLMAADAVYRYKQIANKTEGQKREEAQEIIRCVRRLKRALDKDAEVRDWKVSPHISQFLLEEAEKDYEVIRKNKILLQNGVRNQFRFNVSDILDEIVIKVESFAKEPPDTRLSKKRGKSGLIAFYTNSLCQITGQGFKRPCYAEIATIANAVLETPANKPLTEENVRMNYKSFCKRYVPLTKGKIRF